MHIVKNMKKVINNYQHTNTENSPKTERKTDTPNTEDKTDPPKTEGKTDQPKTEG
jgi:hypothetical protein